MTAADRFDLVVIGGGAAGEKGAARAAYFGKRVAVIERRKQPGGATVHTGTLPSKTLREAALFLSGYRQRDLYGVSVEVAPHLEIARLIARKNAVRELETDRMLENLARHGVELVHGSARLIDASTIEVTDDAGERHRMTTDVILIVTGSSPFRPPGIPFEDPDVHDSDDILEIDHVPASLAVLGGGVIGCEYASMFAVLGTHVHLVERRTPLLPFLDTEIVSRMAEGMRDLGVTFRLGERADAVTRLGVGTDERGRVLVDEAFRTSVPGIYAAGDVIGAPALATSSMEQARVAVSQAFGLIRDAYDAGQLPYGVYTIPEVSSVGLSEQDARARGIDAVVGRASFRDNARGAIIGDRDGMTKLVFDRATRRLIGCHCVGERACELVHVGHAVMKLEGTVDTFIDMVFNYPSLSETYKYAAYDALDRIEG
ncbi:MAG: FAD-binding protein [Actinobacteria bacterium]|nr:MAG: FAD-binding protein [Actinomycetota bacterium]